MKKMVDVSDISQAVANSAGAVGAIVGTKVNAAGYSRANFIFSFGANTNTTAALSAGIGVWAAATSGATFTAVPGASLAAVTSGALSNVVMAIDVPVSAGTPWLLISGGSMLSAAIEHSAIVQLYNGVSRPDTDGYQQVVTI